MLKNRFPVKNKCRLLVTFGWAVAVLIFASIAAPALDSQKNITQFTHRSWGDAYGINNVSSISQTTDGYLWVATINGLFRFDGAAFQLWKPIPGDPNLPAIPEILLATANGSLWVGGKGYVALLQNRHSKIFVFRDSEGRANINALFEDKAGMLWLGTSLGLYYFSKDEWHHITKESSLQNLAVMAITEDHDHALWLGLQSS